MNSDEVRNQLKLQAFAYANLKRGADTLLTQGHIYWTERLILRLTRYLATIRLQQHIIFMHPDDAEDLFGG